MSTATASMPVPAPGAPKPKSMPAAAPAEKSSAIKRARTSKAPSLPAKKAAKTPLPARKVKPTAEAAPAVEPPKKSVPGKSPQLKLVRDGFTMPKAEFEVIAAVKQRSLKLGHEVKKSEVLRAGLRVLAALDDTAFKAAVVAVPRLKTGRPHGKKNR